MAAAQCARPSITSSKARLASSSITHSASTAASGRGSDDPTGLGLNGDGGDVVGDGVVVEAPAPLARRPHTGDLLELQLAHVSNGEPDGAGEQEDDSTPDGVADQIAGHRGEDHRARHDEEADAEPRVPTPIG